MVEIWVITLGLSCKIISITHHYKTCFNIKNFQHKITMISGNWKLHNKYDKHPISSALNTGDIVDISAAIVSACKLKKNSCFADFRRHLISLKASAMFLQNSRRMRNSCVFQGLCWELVETNWVTHTRSAWSVEVSWEEVNFSSSFISLTVFIFWPQTLEQQKHESMNKVNRNNHLPIIEKPQQKHCKKHCKWGPHPLISYCILTSKFFLVRSLEIF